MVGAIGKLFRLVYGAGALVTFLLLQFVLPAPFPDGMGVETFLYNAVQAAVWPLHWLYIRPAFGS